jgi:hypothetical protein
MHEDLESLYVFGNMFCISFSKLEVVVFHDDLRVALADHLLDHPDAVGALVIKSQRVLYYFELVVLLIGFLLLDGLGVPKVLKQEGNFESLTGQTLIDLLQNLNEVANLCEIGLFIVI